ncbi:uncharacterized protein V6R79_005180 [Siganus canaliculatus]
MSQLENLLEDGLRSELMLQQQLSTLRETLSKQLKETEQKQREELEQRIHQDSLLSNKPEQVGIRRATSTSVLTSGKETFHHPRQSQKLNFYSPTWQPPKNWKHCSARSSKLTLSRTEQQEMLDSCKTTEMRKEEEAETECQKKFRALPVPPHVSEPLYQKMMAVMEKERTRVHEQRREFLLSIQKPFSFQEREKEKREKLMATFSKDQIKTAAVQKPHRKPKDSERKDQVLCRQVPTQTAVLEKSPAARGSLKVRAAERTKKEKLGFLYEEPSFQPRIIQKVPDFNKLHKALQSEAMRKAQSKDETRCQPFYLRTSVLPKRQSRMSLECSQEPKISSLTRSKSLGALTSLSADTLPIYITDAVRRRGMAVRKSMELRDNKNQQSADWLRKFKMRSQTMKKTITLHAKLHDPHSSLKEVHNENLQRHRAADQQRMREYMMELRDMKARVSERPYLFEQVKQKNAKAHAEQTYRNKLKYAGVKEQFVEENGEAAEGTSPENDPDDSDSYCREENVDDGKKIEDVEEKSVKSKGEEMP